MLQQNNNRVFSFAFIAFLCLMSGNALLFGQKNQQISDLKNQAEKYFKNSDYKNAMPIYSQLLSNNPKDPLLNYKFGVCLLFVDKTSSSKTVRHLEAAYKKEDVPIDNYYYLGCAYHKDYRFNEAIQCFKEFKAKVKPKELKNYDVDRLIEVSKNGIQLLGSVNDLFVLQKTELKATEIFRSYNEIEKLGGKFIVKPEEFLSLSDRKLNDKSVIFFADSVKEIYYASYGNSASGNKDIYRSFKQADGTWSSPQSIGSPINTNYDEDYPYLMPDGKTLYYCSKGRNSMGGYDIFKTVYDYEKMQWSEPKNLDFAINTPHDDILFVPDSLERYAYFSSNRENIEGMITFYKVRIDKRPPTQFKPIKNIYDVNIDLKTDTTYINTIATLRTKSSLDVNATVEMFDDDPVVNNSNDNNISNNIENIENNVNHEDNANKILNNSDIVELAKTNAVYLMKEASDAKSKVDASRNILALKNKQAKEKQDEAEILIKSSETITDLNEKQQLINQVNNLKAEANTLFIEAKIAEEITKQAETKYAAKNLDAIQANDYFTAIKKAVESKSIDSSIAMLNRMNDQLKKSTTIQDNQIESIVNAEQKNYSIKNSEANKYFKQYEQLRLDAEDIKKEADMYRNKANNSKSPAIKDEYIKLAQSSDDDYDSKQDEIKKAFSTYTKYQKEADSIKIRTELVTNLVDEIVKTSKVSSDIVAESKTEKTVATNSTNNKSNTTSKNISNTTNLKNENVENNKSSTVNNSNSSNIIDKTNKSTNTVVESTNISNNPTVIEINNLDKQLNESIVYAEKYKNQLIAVAIESSKQSKLFNDYAEKAFSNAQMAENNKLQDEFIQQYNNNRSQSLSEARKALLAYNLELKIDSIIKNIENDVAKTHQYKALIEDFIQKNEEEKAKKELIDLKSIVTEVKPIRSTVDYVIKTEEFDTEKLKSEYEELNSLIKNKELEVSQLSQQIESLKKEINETKSKKKKLELQTKLEGLENQSTELKQECNSYRDESEKINQNIAIAINKNATHKAISNELAYNKENLTKNVDLSVLKSEINQYGNANLFMDNPNYLKKDLTALTIAKNEPTASLNQNNKGNNNTNKNSNLLSDGLDTNYSVTENLLDVPIYIENIEKESFKLKILEENYQILISERKKLMNALGSSNSEGKQKTDSQIKLIDEELVLLDEAKSKYRSNFEKYKLSNNIESKSIVDKDNKPINLKNINNNEEFVNILFYQSTLHANKAKSLSEESEKTSKAKDKAAKISQSEREDEIAMYITLEAFEIIAYTNKSDYYGQIFKNADIRVEGVNNSIILEANKLEEIARNEYEKAKQLRDKARYASDMETMKRMMEKADHLERSAIERLKKAYQLYLEYNKSQALAVNNSSSNSNTSEFNNNQSLVEPTSNTEPTNQKNSIPSTNKIESNASSKSANLIDNTVNNSKNISDNNTKSINNESSSKVEPNNKASNNTLTNTGNTLKGEQKNLKPENNTQSNNWIAPSNKSQIAHNEPLPSGLVYKIQIGAFRNAKSVEFFKGLSPISSENAYEDVLSYLVGLFYNREDALLARTIVRNTGFTDAFIVAYNNGKRISYRESLVIEANNIKSIKPAIFASIESNSSSISSSINNNISNANNIDVSKYNTVANVKGIVFRVQVGAYKTPVAPDVFAKFKEMATELSASGYIRYMTGKFLVLDEANSEKARIVQNGIPDAFVVAYDEGVRIPIKQAVAKLSK